MTPHVCGITSWPQAYCFLFSIKFILRSILLHLVINFIWQSPMAVSKVKEHQLFDLLFKCVRTFCLNILFHFFGLLENVVCAVFRPCYNEICFTCTHIKIAVFIQRNHRFERSFQFRLVYIYIVPPGKFEIYLQ